MKRLDFECDDCGWKGSKDDIPEDADHGGVRCPFCDSESFTSLFECVWCKEAGCTPDEYTFPLSEIGGYIWETGKPICRECASNCDDPAQNFELR